MGQPYSAKPKPSLPPHAVALRRPSSEVHFSTHPFATSAPIQRVSEPAPPHTITRWSELIDPEALLNYEAQMNQPSPGPSQSNRSPRLMVESPSGNLLSPAEYRRRPDRKLTVAERKQAIQEETRRKIAMGTVPEVEAEAEPGVRIGRPEHQNDEKKKKKKKRRRKGKLARFWKLCGC